MAVRFFSTSPFIADQSKKNYWRTLAAGSTRGSGFRVAALPGSAFPTATVRRSVHLLAVESVYSQICPFMSVLYFQPVHVLQISPFVWILAHSRGGIHLRIGISGGRASEISVSNRNCAHISPFIRRSVRLFADASIYLHVCPFIRVGSWHTFAEGLIRGSGFSTAPLGSASQPATVSGKKNRPVRLFSR